MNEQSEIDQQHSKEGAQPQPRKGYNLIYWCLKNKNYRSRDLRNQKVAIPQKQFPWKRSFPKIT